MKNLKAWRKANKLTIPEAAKVAKVERATWWRWEAGVRPIGIQSVMGLSVITGIPSHELRPDIFGKQPEPAQ